MTLDCLKIFIKKIPGAFYYSVPYVFHSESNAIWNYHRFTWFLKHQSYEENKSTEKINLQRNFWISFSNRIEISLNAPQFEGVSSVQYFIIALISWNIKWNHKECISKSKLECRSTDTLAGKRECKCRISGLELENIKISDKKSE